MTGSAPALAADAVSHRYGAAPALREVTFAVEAGERFGLLGPNGGGKTTLLRVVSTLLRPTGGGARVFGHDTVREAPAVRRRLGVVFQQPALDGELTVHESLRAHAALVGLSRAETASRIDALLTDFGLADRAGQRVKTLSGGLARRTDLARGLLHRPALLLLDEPTAGLDPLARHDLWDALDRLRRTDGTTQVVATHAMDEAERCDRVGLLDRGRLVALGAPEALKAALGSNTLWLESDDPDGLTAALQNGLDVPIRRLGASVLIDVPDPAALLPEVYRLAGPAIVQATVRKPTLEDVFVAHTGWAFTDAEV